ncbi:MAG TPA: UDP-glucose/GDP-mannose dehydrogenase family protein [Verrucomicrobiae bacterium]|nr:UDP-glucose/GDP-mannose dehydrogenase family protein [Verrucomicrobiae bacterium]
MIKQNTGKDILMVGTGYVGLITALGLAELGNTVACYDINKERISSLQSGRPPFFEPKVPELLQKHLANGRLRFFDNLEKAYTGQRYVFISVQTPQDANGRSDLSALHSAVTAIATVATSPTLLIIKSTVPVGIFNELEGLESVKENGKITFVSCPEFLAEGTAIRDFFHPTRTIVGSNDVAISEEVAGLFYGLGGAAIITDAKTAQMIKYSANSFLATRVAFINDVAEICEKLDVNVNDVAQALVMDPRVGGTYLSPSIGFGGPCLPKDIAALIESSERVGAPALLLRGASEHNKSHLRHVIDTIRRLLGEGKTLTVFGLSFKPNTDDVRSSFSLKIIEALLEDGITVRATDPHAIPAAQQIATHPSLTFIDDPLEAAKGSDLQVFLTPWEAYKQLDLPALASAVNSKNIYDSMNVVNEAAAVKAGFSYHGVGKMYQPGNAPVFKISDNPSVVSAP